MRAHTRQIKAAFVKYVGISAESSPFDVYRFLFRRQFDVTVINSNLGYTISTHH